MGNIPNLHTDPALLDKLNRATSCKLSAREIFEQRVSFVYGCLNADGGATRERVREVISNQEGLAAECGGDNL
jgi:hypothetical protein